jgi:hypothetical protein
MSYLIPARLHAPRGSDLKVHRRAFPRSAVRPDARSLVLPENRRTRLCVGAGGLSADLSLVVNSPKHADAPGEDRRVEASVDDDWPSQ